MRKHIHHSLLKFRLERKLPKRILSINTKIQRQHILILVSFLFLLGICGIDKETESVEHKQSLSYSPIGAIANKLYSLKVTLQWFPSRRGTGRSALNHPNPEKEMENNRKVIAALLMKGMNPCTSWLHCNNVRDFHLPVQRSAPFTI